MFPKTLSRLVLLIAIGGAGLLAYRHFGGSVVAPATATVAVPVTATPAARSDVPVILNGLGTVTATNTVTVRTQVDGQLHQVLFHEGQEVKSGDVLVQIDPRTYQAQLDQAIAVKAQNEAQLANARRDLARYSVLVKKEYATRQQVDTTQALVTQLEAAVLGSQAAIANARVLLGYTTIRSPIDGRAGFRQIDQGNIVHVSDATPIVVITQMRPIMVVFTLPQDTLPDVIKAMAGNSLAVTALSRDGKQVLDRGRLELVDNQIDQTTGTARLKASMPNENGLLWPGQFVNARMVLGTRQKAVTVPASAILRGQQGAYAYVVRADASAEVRPVVVAQSDDALAVIESGVEEGENVVTTGQMRLQNGARVELRTP